MSVLVLLFSLSLHSDADKNRKEKKFLKEKKKAEGFSHCFQNYYFF